MSKLAVVYYSGHTKHFSLQYKDSSPQLVESIVNILRREALFEKPNNNCTLVKPNLASEEDLLTVHEPEYVDFIHTYSLSGGGTLPRATYVNKGTWEAALLSTGSVLEAGKLVQTGHDFAFALSRPPGHHATQDMYGGFCIFNNSAILAKRLCKQGRVMILNWDAHASNGTKHIFYSDPQVLTLSIHQDPTHFFPQEGFVEEIGAASGRGFSINVPMPPRSGDKEYLQVFKSIVEPIYRQFQPAYLIVECGFDAHSKDPLTNLSLTANGYYQLSKRLLDLRESGIVFTLEGGYNINTIGKLAYTVVCALLGKPRPFPEKLPKQVMGPQDTLSYDLVKGLRMTPERVVKQEQTIADVIGQLKANLHRHWKL